MESLLSTHLPALPPGCYNIYARARFSDPKRSLYIPRTALASAPFAFNGTPIPCSSCAARMKTRRK